MSPGLNVYYRFKAYFLKHQNTTRHPWIEDFIVYYYFNSSDEERKTLSQWRRVDRFSVFITQWSCIVCYRSKFWNECPEVWIINSRNNEAAIFCQYSVNLIFWVRTFFVTKLAERPSVFSIFKFRPGALGVRNCFIRSRYLAFAIPLLLVDDLISQEIIHVFLSGRGNLRCFWHFCSVVPPLHIAHFKRLALPHWVIHFHCDSPERRQNWWASGLLYLHSDAFDCARMRRVSLTVRRFHAKVIVLGEYTHWFNIEAV